MIVIKTRERGKEKEKGGEEGREKERRRDSSTVKHMTNLMKRADKCLLASVQLSPAGFLCV